MVPWLCFLITMRTYNYVTLHSLPSRGAPGKSGLHASGEGERVIAPKPWEGNLASRRVEEGLSRSFPG